MLAARGVDAAELTLALATPIGIITGMKVRLRRATTADAPSIAAVHIKSWQSAYRGQLPDDYLDRLEQELPSRTQMWHTHISNPPSNVEIWVAGDDAQIDGFAAFGPARNAGPDLGEVYAIYVDPNRWDQGLGHALFSHSGGRLGSLGFSAATLWVLESNTRARRFYELAGWKLDGRTKLENLPDGIELKEVSYRKELRDDKEE